MDEGTALGQQRPGQAEREENPLAAEPGPVMAGHVRPDQGGWPNALPAARAGGGLEEAQQQLAGGNSYPHLPGREAGAEKVGSSPSGPASRASVSPRAGQAGTWDPAVPLLTPPPGGAGPTGTCANRECMSTRPGQGPDDDSERPSGAPLLCGPEKTTLKKGGEPIQGWPQGVGEPAGLELGLKACPSAGV